MPHMAYLTSEIRHETMGQTMIRSIVACGHLAMSESIQNRFESAAKWEKEGSRIADEADRPFDRMYMQFARGICLDFQRNIEESVIAHERSVEIAQANDIWFMMTFAQPWRGHALYMAGRYKEAMEILRKTQDSAQRTALPYVEAQCCGFASQVSLALGDTETARADAEKALAFGQAHDAPLLEFIGLRSLGRIEEAITLAKKWNYVVWAEELMAL